MTTKTQKKTKEPLTGRQKSVLDWIVDFHKTHEVFPANSDIAAEFKISSGNVSHYLSQLSSKGHLVLDQTKRPVIREIVQ